MATLNSTQRRSLESAVIKARRLAEQGAVKALKNLAVDQTESFSHMDASKRALRNRLRAKGRLVGDEIRNGTQEIANLSYELAYEYWHKMLFARFLEANHLLIHPEHGVAVSLDECAEFAVAEGHTDKWTAAASYASHMLPAIFRPEDPLMQVEFATEDRLALEQLLDGIEEGIFLASDSLGWVYQFWQTEAKAAINASGDKIDGKRLPAVTQLFTESYMVHFLIDNTIGAWWVSRHPGVKPPVNFEYLRFLDDGKPAAGGFDGWPDTTAEVTALDPCMGSGHFIIELFQVMTPLRMFEEGISKEDATRRVIAENLYGLEIDPRCTQIAAFNLALTAWKFCGQHLQLPEMNLACSGIAPKGRREDWVKLVSNVRDSVQRARMENGMAVLYDYFQLAPELGSLLDPTTIKIDAFNASFKELQLVLNEALESEDDTEQLERGVMAAGIAKAGRLLTKKYYLQITNVPYLGKKKFDKILSKYASQNYPDAKGELATIFLERLYQTSITYGVISSVVPHNWLFLKTYKKYRERILKTKSINFIIRLGEHAFENTEAAGGFAALVALSKRSPKKTDAFLAITAANNRGERPIYASEKKEIIKSSSFLLVNQENQLMNPDNVITFKLNISKIDLLSKYADALQGSHTLDIERFRLKFWEIIKMILWNYHSSSPDGFSLYSGYNYVSYKREYNNDFGKLIKQIEDDPNETRTVAWMAGKQAWGKKGIACAWMGKLPSSLYIGQIFDNSVAVILPKDDSNLAAIYTYISSSEYYTEIRKINQKTQVANSTLVKVPFDLSYWQKVSYEKYPNGLPKPYSKDPSQWLFHGHPMISENPLQVALARLLGYHWPAENDKEMELADESKQYIAQIKAFNHLADDDGIVCIPPVNGEKPASERLRDYIKEVWGIDWGNNTIAELLNKEGSTKGDLEQWLRDEFFIQHCKVFQNRPFIWHIWDGRKDGFGALVNYHKLNQDRLKKLIYTYLNDWIRQCELKVKDGESGAEGLLMAARQLKEKLELILQGEPPYDIFVRWKSLHEQPIGWEPDLNDGVRLNIYPFMQAGVLRKNPTSIKWEKDRGKNPSGSYWGEDRFNRYEDLPEKNKLRDANGKVIEHLTSEVKRKARKTTS
ncbi:MAG TPA: hypothetical protein PK711_10210 [Bacteroidales bacterium]|nr:hypothetical protein [Bacteroidales bacterium]